MGIFIWRSIYDITLRHKIYTVKKEAISWDIQVNLSLWHTQYTAFFSLVGSVKNSAPTKWSTLILFVIFVERIILSTNSCQSFDITQNWTIILFLDLFGCSAVICSKKGWNANIATIEDWSGECFFLKSRKGYAWGVECLTPGAI